MDSMTRDQTTERQISDWLVGEGEYELPDRVLDATFHRAAATRQLRALPGWRTFLMDRKVISFAAGAAAVAVVVIAGAAYFGQPDASGVGAAPTPPATPNPEASDVPSPQPSFVAPGITGWKTYTSDVYGYTISIPSDWSVAAPASRKWHLGEPTDGETAPWADAFVNNEDTDGDGIAMLVYQVPAPAGADLESWEGLHAAHRELCDEPTVAACLEDYTPVPMCLDEQNCAPAILALAGDDPVPVALVGDPEKGIVTLIQMGRESSFPAAARYGGTLSLLRSILTQIDVRDPQPGETPH
jgi:hypothetical protein